MIVRWSTATATLRRWVAHCRRCIDDWFGSVEDEARDERHDEQQHHINNTKRKERRSYLNDAKVVSSGMRSRSKQDFHTTSIVICTSLASRQLIVEREGRKERRQVSEK